MQTVRTADHPHNADRTACIVWEDRQRQHCVYRVMAGYIATLGDGTAFLDTFGSQSAAVSALDAA